MMKKLVFLNMAALLLVACNMKGKTATTETAQNTAVEQAAPAANVPEGTEVGNRFIDFALPGIQGNDVRVSDYVSKNKYTLLDFWASWCPPCRAELPYIVRAYADYHDKGFEVIGVSFDNQRQPWLSALEQFHMSWPQMSDLKGWECAGGRLYGIRSIPANFLIDQQGVIVAKDLRGEALIQKIGELLK